MKILSSIMSNLQSHFHFKLDFQNVEKHIGGKWLIHGTKHPQEQSVAKPDSPEYSNGESKHV